MYKKQTALTFQIFACAIFACLTACTVSTLAADEANEPIKLTLHPMAEPQPALKYRLLPEFIDRKPGNAAVYYGKVTAERQAYFGSSGREWRDKVLRWINTPLEELLEEEAYVPVDPIFLRQAARCSTCDWQFPLREERFFEILLPEVQQTREFARILAAHARIQIAHGQFDDAIESFQTGFALGHNVATGETIVSGLVGIAISKVILEQTMEFVQQPNAPNLYWAATMLPRPFINMRDALEAELSAFELSFPEYRDMDSDEIDPEDWAEVLYAFCEYIAVWERETAPGRADELYLELLESYSDAKQALIEAGRSVEEIDAMSKEQVVALQGLTAMKSWQQDIARYFHLSYPDAIEGMNKAMMRFDQLPMQVVPQTERIGSAMIGARSAIARNTRRFEVLRVVEALRIYAAAHDGKLPAQLSDITEVPIPDDPVTGKPFQYQLDGEVAKLGGPAISGVPLNYEIEMHPLDKP